MRVAIDCRMAGHSGIGTVIRNVVPRLARLRSGWSFRLLGAPAEWAAGLADANLAVEPLSAGIYSIGEQFRLRALTGRAATDIVWSPHYNAAVLAPVPLVTTIHDVAHLALPSYRDTLAKRLYATAMLRAVQFRSAAIIFVSHFSRQEFERRVGPPRGESFVIPNAVDEAWSPPVAAPARLVDGDFILFVGNMKPNKNLTALLRALPIVRRRWPVRLVVVGQTTGFIGGDPEALRLAKAMPEAVSLAGVVEDAVLRQYMAEASALVFPSLYEGFGLPPLEAMAAGCPVVASRAAAIPEVCGDAALYFDPSDPEAIAAALLQLHAETGLRDLLVRRGRENVGRFNWDRTAAAVADALASAARI